MTRSSWRKRKKLRPLGLEKRRPRRDAGLFFVECPLRAQSCQNTALQPMSASKSKRVLKMPTDQSYTVTNQIVDGIERITYTPRSPKSETEILFLHGMWHGAWCWQQWQEILAENGWKSRAISLPGHGDSKKRDRRDLRRWEDTLKS